MARPFRHRTEAGQRLAAQLLSYRQRDDVIVLALPRGGVPIGYEIAQALQVPLDVCLVRKLGVPGQPELAMGAIAPGGIMVVNNDLVRQLGIARADLLKVAAQEKQELERRDRLYRAERPFPSLGDRVVILVDDGIATSSTVRAAITVLRQQQPQRIIVAVPVAPASVCRALGGIVDQVICLMQPRPLQSIGLWYDDFSQVSDQAVCEQLQQGMKSV